MVTIHPTEIERIIEYGGVVVDGFLQPDSDGKHCPFKTEEGLCSVHDKKPFGCRASPFTLNKNLVLVVRNKYRLMRCFKRGTVPVYIAHKQSLISIIGENNWQKLDKYVQQGIPSLLVSIPCHICGMLVDNDVAKKRKRR